MSKQPTSRRPFPSNQDLARYINDSPGKVGKREIARAFAIPPEDRAQLRAALKELSESGQIERRRGRNFAGPGKLPPVLVIKVTGLEDDLLLAEPVGQSGGDQSGAGPVPRIFLRPERQKGPALGIGDRALVRVAASDLVDGAYEATVIRRLEAAAKAVLGVYTEVSGGGRILPTSKRDKFDYQVAAADRNGARKGELVSAEILPGRRLGLRAARVVQRFGSVGDPRSISLIAIHEHGLPFDFPAAVLDEAEAAKPTRLGQREDLRDLALITIDGEDARDFDDAVWAQPDSAKDNPGGFHLMVAIADVAHYVRPNSALDRQARKRGNSAYFPDRVVPMLPEQLSNDLCSLRPNVDRPVMAVEIRIDRLGRKLRHRFLRGFMKSTARLTYTQIQAAVDGAPDDTTEALRQPVIQPLYDAYQALNRAREARQPLDLDLPEMRIFLDDAGKISAIRPRQRLDAHKLIEEFMVLANVCAAESLEELKQLCMYRVHEPPELERLQALKEFLASLDISFNATEAARPAVFNRILARARGGEHAEVVNQTVLRAQSQAIYSPENRGHFGLNLRRYAHFTSPIRRYSDLLVHRALISGLKLGADGLSPDDIAEFSDTAQAISDYERRAMVAERDSTDRYIAAYLKDRVGAEFEARISGIIKAGVFVRLIETHADGLVPVSSLRDDYYRLNEERRSLIGDHKGGEYRLGDLVTVRLREAKALSGSMIFEILDAPAHQTSQGQSGRLGRQDKKTDGKKTNGKNSGGKNLKRKSKSKGRRR